MNLGSAFTFLALIISLVLGAITYILFSPIFQILAEIAVEIFANPEMYSDDVVAMALYLFKFVGISGVVFFFFVVAQFLKGYLQPWTNEYQ